jgi:hypothetical protein
VKTVYIVIGALLVLVVGVLIGRELQPSEEEAAPAPTTSTGPNYGKVSCAAGGCTVWGPCPNDVPPQSHWSCTETVTQKEFDQHIQPQLDAQARKSIEQAIQTWIEQNGGPLDPTTAEEYCSTLWDDPDLSKIMSVAECVDRATGN